MSTRFLTAVALAAAVLVTLAGCKNRPDYSRPLPFGADALRRVDPNEWPDLAQMSADAALIEALDRSATWFEIGSTKAFFPLQGFTHDQARASVFAFRQIMQDAQLSSSSAVPALRENFDLWESVGWDGSGAVLFTGYYAPVVSASKVRTEQYKYPLYPRPADLITEPITGEVKGRRFGSQVVPYPTRAQIENYPERLGLAGRELVWLKDRLEAFLVQVQGSAKLSMTDGSTMYIGYAGSNGRNYTSIGRLLVADGKVDPNRLSLPAVMDYFRAHPDRLDYYIQQNERYIFFQEYDGTQWPAGSLGFRVTPERSIATDKEIFPRGGVTIVDTRRTVRRGKTNPPEIGGGIMAYTLDQDTGNAIRAPGRADIYFGIGENPQHLAGRQIAEGRLYYLILKPDRVQAWLSQMQVTPATLSRAQ